MHHHDVLGPEHLIDRLLLSGIEPREVHRRERIVLCRLMRIEKVTQIGKTIATGTHHTLQSIKHETVGSLVERQLQTQSASDIAI